MVAVSTRRLVHAEDLETLTGGVEVAQVHRVAVAEAGGVERLAVVVDRHGAEDDLILLVPVYVGNGHVVVALVHVGLADGRIVGVKDPPLNQLRTVEVIGGRNGAGVVTTGDHHGRLLAVEVGGGCQEPVDPVSVRVTPRANISARRGVVDRVDSRAGLTVEDGEVLRSGEHVAAGVAVVGPSIADHCADAIHRAVRRLHDDLGLAVTVIVEDLELGVVRSGPDVVAQVDPPQPRAIELVGVDVDVAGVAGLGVVLRVGRVPLEDDLVLAIAVDVSDGGVSCTVGVGLTVLGVSIGRLVESHVEGLVIPDAERRRHPLLHTAHHRGNPVGGISRSGRVKHVGAARDRGRGDASAIAVDVETEVLRVKTQQTPPDVDALVSLHSHGGAAQVLSLTDQSGHGVRGDGVGVLRDATRVHRGDLVVVGNRGEHVRVGERGLIGPTHQLEGSISGLGPVDVVEKRPVNLVPGQGDQVLLHCRDGEPRGNRSGLDVLVHRGHRELG